MIERKPFTTRLDAELQRDFKASCAKDGRSMNDILEELMRRYVNKEIMLEKSNPE